LVRPAVGAPFQPARFAVTFHETGDVLRAEAEDEDRGDGEEAVHIGTLVRKLRAVCRSDHPS
jgi:hypothetical protein